MGRYGCNCSNGRFGTTNSRAPPAVRPKPTKPGVERNTGEAMPGGVSNSITIIGPRRSCPCSSTSVKRLARPRAVLIRRISAAAVINTSVAPGRPKWVTFSGLSRSPSTITLAALRGTVFWTVCRARCSLASSGASRAIRRAPPPSAGAAA
jgi:hypothetical protein